MYGFYDPKFQGQQSFTRLIVFFFPQEGEEDLDKRNNKVILVKWLSCLSSNAEPLSVRVVLNSDIHTRHSGLQSTPKRFADHVTKGNGGFWERECIPGRE